MDKRNADTKDKIILPEKLQREMIKFFLEASTKNNAKQGKEQPATPINSKE